VAGPQGESDPKQADLGAGEIVERVDHAADLMRRDPLRRGNIVHLPGAGDLVVLGDIHGDVENFRRVVEWAALHRNRDRYLVLQELFHGGPLDSQGRDSSFRLLEEAAALKCRFRSQVQMVLSNHDLAEMLGATISKSGQSTSAPFWRGIEGAYGTAWTAVHAAYRRLLASLPLAVQTANGIWVSHSTPQGDALGRFDYSVFDRPLTVEDCSPGGSVYALVWGRHHDQASADQFARAVGAEILLTGHQTSQPGVKTPTSRHIILISNGPLGRFLLVRLNAQLPHQVLVRQVTKIRSIEET
jgi:hypothetical protein